MNSDPHNPMAGAARSNSGEETLRLMASLPAPEGLEERVHKALGARPRKGQVVAWPARFRARAALESNWMRATAAAAIVFVVVGGGWGVYSRVQSGQAGKVVVMPARVPAAGGFSNAGAMRTPETLPGPKIGEQATPASTDRSPGARAGSEGARELGGQSIKKSVAPKKVPVAQPAANRAAARQVAP
jgi:hypothetical protein